MLATDYMALGLDFGGVIAAPTRGGAHHVAELDPRHVAPVPGAEQALAELLELFRGRVWLISKASQVTRDWTSTWLDIHGFYDVRRMQRDHVEFVAEPHEKREHCLIHGITHFVDDQLCNLELLRGAVDWLCLFGAEASAESDSFALRALGWDAALRLIRESVAESVANATPQELQATLAPDRRKTLEGSMRCALARFRDPNDPLERMDRDDCVYDLNHLFWGVPAATRVLTELARRADDDPDVTWWAGYYLGDLWLSEDEFPLDQVSRLSESGREGLLARVEDERSDLGTEIRSLSREDGHPD